MSTVILDSIVKTEEHENGFHVTKFNPAGDAHARAIVDAVIDNYEAIQGDMTSDIDQLAAQGAKVTVLHVGETMFGARSIVASEGTLFIGARTGKVALLPKGKRKNGNVLTGVLDIITGYGGTERLRGRVDEVRQYLPTLSPLTQADLDALPDDAVDEEGNTSDCTLAVFGSLPWFDGPIIGAMWLICGYDKENDIADGVLLVPDGIDAVSEHGSVYGRDLLRHQVGKVEGFQPLSFRTALHVCDYDYPMKLAILSLGANAGVVA